MSQPIVFSKAGKIMLVKYVNGIPVRSPENVYFRNGAVQQITPNITINGSPIADGNSLWAAANPDTSIEGSIAVQLGFMPPGLYAFIMGDTTEELTNSPFPMIDEEITVPMEAPYTVKLKHKPIDGTIILVDKDAKPWDKSTSTPSAGEYYVDSQTPDELEFDESDAGKSLFVSYDYLAPKVSHFGLPKNPVRPAYQLIVSGEAAGEDESPYEAALIVDKCKVLGAINPPQQGGTPSPVTITFTVLKPRGNNKAVDYKITPITA